MLKESVVSEKGKYDVFVSYSSKNKNVADAIVADFEQHGIRCWYAPRDIMPGTSWVSAITDALRMVKVQVLIYTDESNTSRQVMNEVALAFNEGKTIVPFRLSETRMSDEFEYYLSRVHWLDAVTKNLSDNIIKLRSYVEVILSGVEKANTAAVRESKKKFPVAYKIIGICAAVLILSLVSITAYLIFSDNDGDGIRTYESDVYVGPEKRTDGSGVYVGAESRTGEPGTYVGPEKRTEESGEYAETERSTEDYNAYDNPDNPAQTTNDSKEAVAGADTSDTSSGDDNKFNVSTETGNTPMESNDNSPTGTGIHEARDNSVPGDKTASTAQVKDIFEMTVDELETAAVKGDAAACELLGSMYYNGEKVDQNYGKARMYLERAVENNSASAKAFKVLGDIYFYGQGVDESDEEAGRYYKAAIDMGISNYDTLANYGMILYRDDRFEESAVFFEKSAELDSNPTTMYNAGLAYYGAEDFENAVKWFEKAIDNGFARPKDAQKLIETITG